MSERSTQREDLRVLAHCIDHPDEFVGTQEICNRLKRIERLVGNLYSADIADVRKRRAQEELSQKQALAKLEKTKAKIREDTYKKIFSVFNPVVGGTVKQWHDTIETWGFTTEPQEGAVYVERITRHRKDIKIEDLFKQNFPWQWNHAPTETDLERIQLEMHEHPLACAFDTIDERAQRRRVDRVYITLKRR